MNEHIKSLYPWARNYDKGGPIKRQNLLAGMKTPEQVAAETMSVAENTKTQSSIDATEQRLQANKIQKERMQQQLSQQNAEIKPQNENPLRYASTNPLTQQIANLGYTNEQNPQTWYRPGYDYQQQYFSPEIREQTKNDISNFTSLLFGATFPEMLPLLAAYGSNELFNNNEQSKQDINSALNTAGFFIGGTHSVRDLFNRGKNVAKNTVEQVKLAKNFKPRQIAQEGDFIFEPFRGQDENLIGSVFYNKRDLQHKSGSKYGQKNILGRSLERILRGGVKSDVYVEKSLMDQADLPNVTLNPLKKTSRGFKSTFGKNANPKDYYKVSTEQLLTSKIPTNANEQKVYDAISNQVMPQLKTKVSNQVVPVFYNPKTAKSPGSVLRWGLYTLPTMTTLGAMTNTALTSIGQWQDYKNMQNRLQDTDYADFQDLYYDLPQQDRDNISVIVSNYLNNPYELETKQQFDALVSAFEQQYGEKGLRMLDAYVKYQTPSYSNPVQIHPIDATKTFVDDHIYQFSFDNEEPNNTFAKGGPIHIKKENRGKFTAAAERAGKSVQAYASQILANKGNYSPTLVKRANFARNAAKWHAYGGNLYDAGGGKGYPWHPPMSTYSINRTQPAGTAMSNPYAVRQSQPVAWSGLMKQLNTSLAANIGAYVPVINTGVPSYFRHIKNTNNMTKSSDPVEYQRNRLHFVENKANVGYDPVTQRYVAYDSVEGGEQTVGDGLKLYPNEAWTKLYNRQGYLTKQQHDDFINARIRKDIEATRRFYDTTNNDVGAFDRLSPEMQAWLIDYNYNPGITQFPKLVKAIYVDDKDSIRKESSRTVRGKPLGRNKIMLNDLDLIESGQYTGSYAQGGSIHIKPENRGKFTAAANRAGKSVQEYASQILANKDHYSTTLVKRANFAKNAKKFHH